jgi:hypothetical protein
MAREAFCVGPPAILKKYLTLNRDEIKNNLNEARV